MTDWIDGIDDDDEPFVVDWDKELTSGCPAPEDEYGISQARANALADEIMNTDPAVLTEEKLVLDGKRNSSGDHRADEDVSLGGWDRP